MATEKYTIIDDNEDNYDFSRIARTLFSNYHTFMQDVNVWELVENVLPASLYEKIEPLKLNVVGHNVINDIVMKYYPGEHMVKYELIKRYLNRVSEVSAFEIKVNNSRLDFGRINGSSYAYEIKTELDSLDKLKKQVDDYSSVFEYIYIVVHINHYKKALEIIPDHCGLITYRRVGEELKFSFKRRVTKSPALSKESMLSNLNSKEISFIFKQLEKNNHGLYRDEKVQILRGHSFKKINALFKRALKERYNKQWNNLCYYLNDVNPIDVQAVFKSGTTPEQIYYKNSLSVFK